MASAKVLIEKNTSLLIRTANGFLWILGLLLEPTYSITQIIKNFYWVRSLNENDSYLGLNSTYRMIDCDYKRYIIFRFSKR